MKKKFRWNEYAFLVVISGWGGVLLTIINVYIFHLQIIRHVIYITYRKTSP